MPWPAEAEMGDLVYGILATIYGPQQARFRCHANRQHITLEQLAAAAIAGALSEFLHQDRAEPALLPTGERAPHDHGRRRSGPSRPRSR